MTAKFSLSEKNRTRLWLIYFAVLFFWGLNACFYLGKTYAKGEMFAYEIDKHPYVSDFINSYSAGVLCSRCLKDRDNPPDIYNSKVQADLQNELIAPIKPENPFYNQYPPVMFLFFLPLSLLSMGQAWIAYCVFAFLLNAALLYYLVLPAYKTVQEKVFLITAIFSSYPFWFACRLGQPALLLMPTILVFFHCLKNGNMLLAGLTSSLVLLKLQYLPVVVAIGFGAGSPGLIVLIGAAILLGVMNVLFFFLLRAPTLQGRKLLDEIEGFKLYMKTAEEDRLNMLNPPEKTPALFERYLPYALALDCENEWNAKFAAVLAAAAAAGASAPLWYS
ncbi:MAG TPA: DUF2207 domain-containing protein, partial [Candidatus Obscuribacter sp.]|nr:DUF2207 domain-containing protein [Candidatus Obscuribacter sp.]